MWWDFAMHMGLDEYLMPGYINKRGKGMSADGFGVHLCYLEEAARKDGKFRVKFEKWIEEIFSSSVWPGLNYMRNDSPDQAYSFSQTNKKPRKKEHLKRHQQNRFNNIHARSTPTIARSARGISNLKDITSSTKTTTTLKNASSSQTQINNSLRD